MAEIDLLDAVILVALLGGTVLYFTKGILWAVEEEDPYACPITIETPDSTNTIKRLLEGSEKQEPRNCIIFYGSQSGTAETCADTLAREAISRLGLSAISANLEKYSDYSSLRLVPKDTIVMFVMATYGDGDPTDSAISFYEFLTGDDVPSFSGQEDSFGEESDPLKGLRYIAFGLGDKSYSHYNKIIRDVTAKLDGLGATMIGKLGLQDDSVGGSEEQFLKWKDQMWQDLAAELKLELRDVSYIPSYHVVEKANMNTDQDKTVYKGELSNYHLKGENNRTIYGPHNPLLAPVTSAYNLFDSPERKCIHVEFSLKGSGMTYKTGDHLAIWPPNSGKEVDRFLRVTGTLEKRHCVVDVQSNDRLKGSPIASPATYDAIARYYLAICDPITRNALLSLADVIPDSLENKKNISMEFKRLASDPELFAQEVLSKKQNIAQLLLRFSGGKTWEGLDFSVFFDILKRQQVRYYSISSASSIEPDTVSITAAIEIHPVAATGETLKGVATNYLLALQQTRDAESDPNPDSYDLAGPRNKLKAAAENEYKVAIHVRHSLFRLPKPNVPIVMIGPGTGVAPFRAFMQERQKQFKEIQSSESKSESAFGKSVLFYGCRKKEHDYMYGKEWEDHKRVLGDKFEMHTAFSRAQKEKEYVQNLIPKCSTEICSLYDQGAHFYICGDGSEMAPSVKRVLGQILARHGGSSAEDLEEKGRKMIEELTIRKRLLEDVWSS